MLSRFPATTHKRRRTKLAVAALLTAAMGISGGVAADPLTLRAGRIGSYNNRLAAELAETLAQAADPLPVAVEESQNSVQNVNEATERGANALFIAPPATVLQALAGQKPFAPDPRFETIRALSTVPFLTVHWVVRADSGLRGLGDLAGKPLITGGRGSFSERQTAAVLKALSIAAEIRPIELDVNAILPALKDHEVAGLSLAGAYPLAQLTEIAQIVPIRLLGLTRADLDKVLPADDSLVATAIPSGTYPGVDDDVTTVALPTGLFTTTQLSADDAYRLTKALWERKPALDARFPHWGPITPETFAALGIKLHQGALRYYDETARPVPPTLR